MAALQSPYVERVDALIAALKATLEPGAKCRYDQSVWAERFTETRADGTEHPCGTACCLAGGAVSLMPGFTGFTFTKNTFANDSRLLAWDALFSSQEDSRSVWSIAADWLGLDYRNAEVLFQSDPSNGVELPTGDVDDDGDRVERVERFYWPTFEGWSRWDDLTAAEQVAEAVKVLEYYKAHGTVIA